MHDVIMNAMQNAGPEIQYGFLGSLIGGLFARSSAKKAARAAEEAAKIPMVTETEHNVDLNAMNEAAIAAGYNPMTLLNAGGLSAFTRTKNTTTGHNAMAAAQAKAAVPSVGSVFAGAMSSTLDSLTGSAFKAMAPLSADYYPPAPSAGGSMASALGWDAIRRTAGGGASLGGGAQFATMPTLGKAGKIAMGSGAPMLPEIERPKTTNPHKRLDIDPSIAGAEAYQQRYGDSEVASTLAWGMTSFDDLWYNVTGMTSDQRYERWGQPLVNGAKSAYDSVKAGALRRDAKDAATAVGGAMFGAEKWFRRNVQDVWWPN